MASSVEPDRAELVQLVLLLALVGGFYVVVIPAGILDPEGFSLDGGLPPSFSARLAAGLAALVITLRLARLLLVQARVTVAEISSAADLTDTPTALNRRSWAGVVMSLVFALVLIPLLGFMSASVLVLGALMVLLGERRRAAIVTYPLLVVSGVWLLFGYLLSVRLPPGWLLPWLMGS